MAPERTRPQPASSSRRSSASRWNSSASTAADVARGRRSVSKASTQGPCQRSSWSRSASMAPVSMRPLACTALSQFPPQTHASQPGAIGIVTMERPHEAHGRSAKTLLLEVVRPHASRSGLNPFVGHPIEQIRDARPLGARGLLQRRLASPGESPTVDVGLSHARQCSAPLLSIPQSLERLWSIPPASIPEHEPSHQGHQHDHRRGDHGQRPRADHEADATAPGHAAARVAVRRWSRYASISSADGPTRNSA